MGELHRNSLQSEQVGRKAARAFGNVSQLEVAGVKLRDVVLRNIQTDFKSKIVTWIIFHLLNHIVLQGRRRSWLKTRKHS